MEFNALLIEIFGEFRKCILPLPTSPHLLCPRVFYPAGGWHLRRIRCSLFVTSDVAQRRVAVAGLAGPPRRRRPLTSPASPSTAITRARGRSTHTHTETQAHHHMHMSAGRDRQEEPMPCPAAAADPGTTPYRAAWRWRGAQIPPAPRPPRAFIPPPARALCRRGAFAKIRSAARARGARARRVVRLAAGGPVRSRRVALRRRRERGTDGTNWDDGIGWAACPPRPGARAVGDAIAICSLSLRIRRSSALRCEVQGARAYISGTVAACCSPLMGNPIAGSRDAAGIPSLAGRGGTPTCGGRGPHFWILRFVCGRPWRGLQFVSFPRAGDARENRTQIKSFERLKTDGRVCVDRLKEKRKKKASAHDSWPASPGLVRQTFSFPDPRAAATQSSELAAGRGRHPAAAP